MTASGAKLPSDIPQIAVGLRLIVLLSALLTRWSFLMTVGMRPRILIEAAITKPGRSTLVDLGPAW